MKTKMLHYSQDRLYEEIAFLAYYLHWDYTTLISMTHDERQRWCQEVSKINKQLNTEEKSISILDI